MRYLAILGSLPGGILGGESVKKPDWGRSGLTCRAPAGCGGSKNIKIEPGDTQIKYLCDFGRALEDIEQIMRN